MMKLIVSNFRLITTCLFWSLVLYMLGLGRQITHVDDDTDVDGFCARNHNWDEPVDPVFKLREDHFLLPVLCYGPNNQVVGFRESIVMAVKLNRTLIAPPFFKHKRNDESATDDEQVLGADSRVDVDRLRELIPIKPGHSAHEACNNQFDAFYTTRMSYCSKIKLGRLAAACQFWQVDCGSQNDFIIKRQDHQTHQCPPAKVPVYPLREIFSDEIKDGHKPLFINNLNAEGLSKMHSFYDTYHRCPLLGFPYRSIGFHSIITGQAADDVTDDDIDLVRQVFRYTQRPKYIRAVAEKFISRTGINDYIALHWRYNKNDWMQHCSEATLQQLPESERQVCNTVSKIMDNPLTIASSLVKYLSGFDFGHIYIATPPDARELIAQVKHHIEHAMPKLVVLLSDDLVPVLDETFSRCQYYDNERYEIVSLAEMEICSRSALFLRSSGSSWSMNINYERIIDGRNMLDAVNTDLFNV